ncbi:amino acid adenylation domain-containing protein, partial [Kitasatospora sp. NPDC093806]|uniref:amino acid adenylation domain-containing protein n=1 Tax=Kitasatospora sp. NPDC093806 TaxID=3155075 RepID=UPI00341AC5BE
RDTTLEAFNHQDLPFEQLIEHLAPPRDTSRNPLIQAWFDLFSADSRLQLAGVRVDRTAGGDATTRFDLELHLTGGETGPLGVELVYATDLFDQATMERLADHYATLLRSIATNPYHRVDDLVMTTPEELATLLATEPATPLPAHATLTDWFHHQVAATPEATALVHDGERLSYAELNTRANHIAWTLREQGHGPESSVALLLPRGIDQLTHLLAILKAGAAYLALDPEHPEDRIHFQLTDSGTRLTITTPELRHKLPADAPVLLSSHQHPHNPVDPPTTHGPHSHAYTIYTSGTTGRPKGIAMAHEPLLNLLQWQLERAVTNGPTLQFSALNFDISFQEIFSTWLGGGAVVLLDEDARRDPERMLDIMRTHGVRRLFCPPLVLEQISQAAATAAELPPLAEIMTAGEQLHLVGEIRDLIDRLPGVRIDNQYGPSEAHVITAHLLAGDPAGWPTAPPVGTAIANTEVYLLDGHGNPTPFGVPGEIHVGGTCLARGYTGRPDLTADRFVPNPYGEPGSRLYRTGDLARHRPDGTLEFLGRADFQVKIRGYRIEPGEIETLLSTHPGIEQAAVVPVEPTPGDLRLAAYYVPAAGSDPTPGELREFLARTLPAYMVPSHLVPLAALPLTGPGKLDRKALPLPDREAGADDAYLAPRNPREAAIAAIWAEVINLSKVGVTDDFFEIGGHSLLATKVIARVRAAFEVDLPVRAVFNGRTVAALAEAVAAAERPVIAPLLSKPRDARPPLSFAQQRLWFLDRFQPGMTAYHVFQGYRLKGALDPVALERAWQAVEERHEVLRSRFGNDGDQPHVIVDPAGTIPLERLDLSGAADPEQAAREHTQRQADQPFDLATGPLTRAHLLHLAPQDHILLITVHHSIFDGWSINVLENDLT